MEYKDPRTGVWLPSNQTDSSATSGDAEEAAKLQTLLTEEFACYRPTYPAGLYAWARIALLDNSPHHRPTTPAPQAATADAQADATLPRVSEQDGQADNTIKAALACIRSTGAAKLADALEAKLTQQAAPAPTDRLACVKCHSTKRADRDVCMECGGKEFRMWADMMASWGRVAAPEAPASEQQTDQAHVLPPTRGTGSQHDAGAVVLSALRDGIPLQEPVNITKAVLAQREARVCLSGGIGPVACAMLVNIQLTPWADSPEKAKAFASGYNTAMKWYRAALLELAEKDSADAACRFRAQGGITNTDSSNSPAATTASASGEKCKTCNGTGYFYEDDSEVGAVARECEGCDDRAPAPSREEEE